MTNDSERHEGRDHVIESASATTSHDNERSGPLAYVVFCIVVGLLALAVLGLSSCVSSALRLVALGVTQEQIEVSLPLGDDPVGQDDSEGLEELEELMRDLGITDGGAGGLRS